MRAVMLSRLAAVLAVLALAGCGLHQDAGGDVCTAPRKVDDRGVAAGTASGAVDLQTPAGTSSASFATAPSGAPPMAASSATMTGTVSNGGGAASLVVNVDTSAFQPYAQFTLPDVRTLEKGAVVAVPASGSVAVDGGWCNFAASASLTVRDAVGGAAPSPQFVTADFVRTADLVLEVTPDKPVAGSPDGKAPDCGATVAVHASIRLTADSYATATDDGSCLDLGK